MPAAGLHGRRASTAGTSGPPSARARKAITANCSARRHSSSKRTLGGRAGRPERLHRVRRLHRTLLSLVFLVGVGSASLAVATASAPQRAGTAAGSGCPRQVVPLLTTPPRVMLDAVRAVREQVP